MRHRMDPTALWVGTLIRSRWYQLFFGMVIILNLSLSLMEQPSTIRLSVDGLVSRIITDWLELVCISVVVTDVALRYRHLGSAQFWQHKAVVVKAVYAVAAIVGVLGNLIWPRFFRFHRMVRPLLVAVHFRNVSKICTNMLASVPKVVNVMILLIVHVIFFGLVAHIIFGGIDFDPETGVYQCKVNGGEGKICDSFSKNCFDYFGHFGNSMNNLFVLLTTANYPDVMIPAYHCYHPAALFFILYLIIGLYFVMNLILAVAYSHFQEKTKETVLESVTLRVECLDTAYDFITQSGHFDDVHHEAHNRTVLQRHRSRYKAMKAESSQRHLDVGQKDTPSASVQPMGISVETDPAANTRNSGSAYQQKGESKNDASDDQISEDLDAPVRENSEFGSTGAPEEIGIRVWHNILRSLRPDLTKNQRAVLFQAMDQRGCGSLSKDDFRDLISFLEVKFKWRDQADKMDYLGQGTWCPDWIIWCRLCMRQFVYWLPVRYFFDGLIYLNGLLVLVEFALQDASLRYEQIDTTLRIILVVFVVELTMKLFGMGIREFCQDGFNVFDLIVVPGTAVAEIMVYFRSSASHIVAQLAFLRMVRLVRALRALKGFGIIMQTFAVIIPTFIRYVVVAFIAFYVFGVLGMELFAGVTHNMPPDTAYAENYYEDMSFDSMWRSLVVLWALMVVNNWPIIMDGVVAVTDRWSMLFFYLWYFTIVIVVLNIVTAFLLENYTVMRAQLADEANGIIPLWKRRIMEACTDLGMSRRKQLHLSRKEHTSDVYEIMFEQEIIAHMRAIDEVEEQRMRMQQAVLNTGVPDGDTTGLQRGGSGSGGGFLRREPTRSGLHVSAQASSVQDESDGDTEGYVGVAQEDPWRPVPPPPPFPGRVGRQDSSMGPSLAGAALLRMASGGSQLGLQPQDRDVSMARVVQNHQRAAQEVRRRRLSQLGEEAHSSEQDEFQDEGDGLRRRNSWDRLDQMRREESRQGIVAPGLGGRQTSAMEINRAHRRQLHSSMGLNVAPAEVQGVRPRPRGRTTIAAPAGRGSGAGRGHRREGLG